MLTGWNDGWTDEDVRTSFAANVKRIRGERKLTQGELAEKMGYTRNMISMMENGRVGATLPTLLRLAWSLDVDPTTLLARVK